MTSLVNVNKSAGNSGFLHIIEEILDGKRHFLFDLVLVNSCYEERKKDLE